MACSNSLADILESSGIAWPNAAMWRTVPFTSSVPPARQLETGVFHAHSPRSRYLGLPDSSSLAQVMAGVTSRSQTMKHRPDPKQPTYDFQESQPNFNPTAADPFVEANAYFEWLSGIGMGLNGDASLNVNSHRASRAGRKSSTDTSMPDYVSATQTPPLVEQITASFAGKNDDEADMAHMKVPTNTPTTCGLDTTQAEGASRYSTTLAIIDNHRYTISGLLEPQSSSQRTRREYKHLVPQPVNSHTTVTRPDPSYGGEITKGK